VGPSGQAEKRKERTWFGSGPKGAGPARSAQQARLGSRGQLGLRLSRPSRFLELTGSSWAVTLLGPRWAGGLLLLRLLLHAGGFRLLPSR
jgi:hypothetical protein